MLEQQVLPTGLGNPEVVLVWTGKTIWFGFKTVEEPYLLLFGRPNPDPYPLTRRIFRVWIAQSVLISCSAFRIFYLLKYSDILYLITKIEICTTLLFLNLFPASSMETITETLHTPL